MSKFLAKKYKNLNPYVPGEQLNDKKYIKLNTNESPFAPSKKAIKLAGKALKKCMLYPDPEGLELRKVLAQKYGVSENNIILSNGSDEVLNFAFMAYCDEQTPAVFADITYGFYKVFAQINCLPTEIIPLNVDFTINVKAFCQAKGTIFIANPNAPTGICLTLGEIEKIVKSKKNRIVVIDEAYIDFGGESAVSLISKYDNLLITQTFSKSRSMAGARLGVGIACEKVIEDLNRVRNSLNPYNVNRATMAMGIGAIKDEKYFEKNVSEIIKNRTWAQKELESLGFTCTPSKANFIFAKTSKISGKELYLRLKDQGVLVRFFDKPLINEYNRISVGNIKQMQTLIEKIKTILEK